MKQEGGSAAPRVMFIEAPKAHYFWHRARRRTSPSDWRTRDCSIHHVYLLAIFLLSSCATRDTAHRVVISVPEQKMAVLEKGVPIATYPISTSKFGMGDYRGSWGTPLGKLEVVTKIGEGAPLGAVFKDRRFTGEILPIDAPGRDPIVTRILWLRGKELQNQNAYYRYIYIHGTPEERNVGLPVSYGCVRMRSSDVIQLYDIVGLGAEVTIVNNTLHSVVPAILPPGGRVAQMKEPFAGAIAR